MNIWFGIDVDNYYKDIRREVQKIEKELNFALGMLLPYHISLKMSFNVSMDMKESIIESLVDYFKCLVPFEVETNKIECHDNIVWIRMKKNNILDNIHIDLNSMLLEKYNIGLHEYDLDFLFHTTLFMDNDEEKIKKAYERIKDITIPKAMLINKYIIGISETGEPGTYTVIKEIEV